MRGDGVVAKKTKRVTDRMVRQTTANLGHQLENIDRHNDRSASICGRLSKNMDGQIALQSSRENDLRSLISVGSKSHRKPRLLFLQLFDRFRARNGATEHACFEARHRLGNQQKVHLDPTH